jgi:hypothetical protein
MRTGEFSQMFLFTVSNITFHLIIRGSRSENGRQIDGIHADKSQMVKL